MAKRLGVGKGEFAVAAADATGDTDPGVEYPPSERVIMQIRAKDGVAVASFEDTLLAIWQAPAEAARCRWLSAELERLANGADEGILVLYVILPSSSPPDAAVRTQIQADLAKLGTRLRRLVVVPLGNTVWFNLTRAIMRGLLLLSGQSKKFAVVSGLNEGIEELQRLRGARTPSRQELRAALSELSATLGVERPDPKSSVWAEGKRA